MPYGDASNDPRIGFGIFPSDGSWRDLRCLGNSVWTHCKLFNLLTIYLLGHLTPTIVESSAGGLPLVEFFAQLISAVIPNLSHFSMEAAIDADVRIPWSVISSVLVYTTIYGIAATLIGLLLFEDRDLA